MGLTKLAAKLPDDTELNGLDHWMKHLKEHPFEQLVIVAFVDTQKLITDYEKGQVHPVVQIQAVEVIDTAIDCPAHIRQAFDAARDRRINRSPLFNDGDDDGSTTTIKEPLAIEVGDPDVVIDVEFVDVDVPEDDEDSEDGDDD